MQDWTGQRTTSVGDRLWWTWQLDQQRYPGWDGMVASLNASGIEVLTYINPWLVNVADKGDASIRNLSAEAAQAGYLVKNAAGQPSLMDQNGFDAALMDFTDPAARDWYADMIAEDVIGAGAAGFMADFGEGMPYDGVLFDGTPATEHNRYPQLWAQVVQEGCQPARRRTWLVHPGTKAADADLQFFLGGHLPVAPVTAQAATTVPVSFPPGTWVHVLSVERYDGDRTTDVPAPLGTPAAFVRFGDPIGQQIIDALAPVR